MELNKYILSTANPENRYSHRIIVESVKSKEEHIQKTSLPLCFPPRQKIEVHSLKKLVTLIFKNLIENKFFGVRGVGLYYKGVNIGKYVVATALHSHDSYRYKIKYYFRFVRSIYKGIQYIDFFQKIQSSIIAVYVNDPFYMSGIFCELAAKNGIALYHNTSPYRLTRFKNNSCLPASEYFCVHPKKTGTDLSLAKKMYNDILKKTESIPYMSSVKFEEKQPNIKWSEVYAVIYAHSFTDAQQGKNVDYSFLSVFDWLLYTLRELRGKKVILKAHPSFYREGYQAAVVRWDREIWEQLLRNTKFDDSVQIIDWPMRNVDLLKSINKDCLLVSHHGSALIEGGGLGFKCLCSTATQWKNFKLFNSWKTREEYSEMLLNPDRLERTSPEKVYEYVYDLYADDSSFASKKGWRYVVETKTGIPAIELSRDSRILQTLSENELSDIISEVSRLIGDVHLS